MSTATGGAPLITEPVIGIVKNNIDPTHSGRIQIYSSRYSGIDPNVESNWISVRYLSPFCGISSPNNDPQNGPDRTGYGAFVGNPVSYGFWASAPDIGTQVICVFVDGRIDQGYYIGCVPQAGLLQMTPAIGATNKVVPNETESTSYGGVDRLPTGEVNMSNPAIQKSTTAHSEPKPIHSYQAAILNEQGLIRDNIRGVISSSAQRETPSRVFGISTPGGPIFEGGYTSTTIKDAIKTADPSKLKQIGRTGGHTLVMDDGTLTGQDQLIRLRSSAGHQITMSDTGQTLFITHSNGQSWIELGKEGTVDIYSTNSFNVRTQGDINFHADRDVNINAAKNLNLFGENVNIESSKNTNFRTGVNFSAYTLGAYTVKVDGAMSQHSSGQASYASEAETFVNGAKVNLNSGNASLTPAVVALIAKTSHVDTINSPSVGWMNPSPEPLISVTNRAPAHQPWINSGKGVDVTIKSTAVPATSRATPEATTANESTPSTPAAPTTAAEISAVPSVGTASIGPITPAATQAIVAQVATSAQSSATPITGMINQASGMTTKIAEAAGAIKPGAGAQVAALAAAGMPVEKALSGAVTGLAAATSATTVVNNVVAQAGAVATGVINSATTLLSKGILTGNESIAQASGLVMGAVTSGVKAVTDFVKTGVSSVTGLVDSIAGGKFAAGLADKLSLPGLSSSLSGLVGGITGKLSSLGNSISGLADSLKSGLQSAFDSVEKSFGTLKAGMPNVLGPPGTAPAVQPSAVQKASNAYDSAAAELSSAETAFYEAKRNYRNDPTPENNAKITEAEAAISAARQKQTQASTSFATASVGAITGSAGAAVGGIVDSVKSSLTSGLNSLPGGASVLQSTINSVTGTATGAISGVMGSITGAVNTAVSAVGNAVGSAVKGAVGGVIGSAMGSVASSAVSGALGSAVNSVSSAVSGALGSANNSLGSLSSVTGAMSSAVGAASSAVGGLVANAQSAVTGALGKIPGIGALTGKLDAGVAGVMGQLNASMSSIGASVGGLKTAVAAVGTFDKSAIVAKTGQLLGNAKIPSPSTIGSDTPSSSNPDTQSDAVTSAIDAVKEAQSRVNSAKLNLTLTKASPFSDATKIKEIEAMLATEEASLKTAQAAYTALVT